MNKGTSAEKLISIQPLPVKVNLELLLKYSERLKKGKVSLNKTYITHYHKSN